MRILLAACLSFACSLSLFAADVVKPAGEGAPIIAPIGAKVLPALDVQSGLTGIPQAVVPAIPGAPEGASVEAPQAPAPNADAPLAKPELEAVSPENAGFQGPEAGELSAEKI